VVQTGPANVNDHKPALELLDAIPPIRAPRGRPRYRPAVFQGDAAYGVAENIAGTIARGIKSALAPRGKHKHGSGLGRTRWVIERGLAWFGFERRLKFCYERIGAHFQAFHDLAAGLICARKLDALNRRF